MRAFDLTPLYRATVGFDQVADLMDRALANDVGQNTYPLTTSKRPMTTHGVSLLLSPVFLMTTSRLRLKTAPCW